MLYPRCFRKEVLSKMNAAHFHLIINHLPVIGSMIAFLLLLIGLVLSNNTLRKTGGMIFILCALATIPVYLSGEPAEEVVEGIGGISEAVIENHEEWAKFALGGMGLLGVLSLGTFAWIKKDKTVPTWFAGLLLAVSLVPMSLIGYTANLGGKIRHTEIAGTSANNATGEQQGTEPAETKAGDDDDN